ncbi:hypothetical protein FB451DRAFT_1455655 [Mycena latifolia]|nr:hypothetical protein FB451DRAFT_1455655 [Mycena latifolia]
MLGCLNLSRLRDLRSLDGAPLVWNQNNFFSFASRSSLSASLTALEIEAVIQEDELLQCLELLTSLEELTITDCEDFEGGHVLITDNLLHRLVWRPNDDTSLVPRLIFPFLLRTTILRNLCHHLVIVCVANPSHPIPNPEHINQLREILRSNSLSPEISGFRALIAEAPSDSELSPRYNNELQETLTRIH